MKTFKFVKKKWFRKNREGAFLAAWIGLRDGHVVYISATGKITCPIFWPDKYIKEANLKHDDYLFCLLNKTKNAHNVQDHIPISYNTMRKTFKDTLVEVIGEESNKNYGLHSLRSGGATAAPNNNVPDRLIRKHGRCLWNTSRDLYIKDSNRKRLDVLKSLDI